MVLEQQVAADDYVVSMSFPTRKSRPFSPMIIVVSLVGQDGIGARPRR